MHFGGISLLLLLTVSATAAPLKVDVNPDTQRKDALTPLWENWMVKDGAQASHTFGNITITLRPAGSTGSGLAGSLWKPGYETKATMASDGVSVKDGDKGGSLELVIHGLLPGRHSIVTYHNSLTTEPVSSYRVEVDGQVKLKGVQPSTRVTSDTGVASAFVEFESVAGKDVVITIRPEGNAAFDNVILNGFTIDTPDPAKLAINPSPASDDEHAVENTTLTWSPAKSAVSHHLYLGTNAGKVAAATNDSPEFKGSLKEPKFQTKGLNHMDGYYWRVDEVDDKQTVTKGEVWHFGIRHLAFPTAEGYGRFARGGRGGRVIEVTNLEDYDAAKGDAVVPGSFREAVEAEGPRTIVFRVSGLIKLKRPCAVHNPYCTIAGQTAPGDGICLANYASGAYGTHDVIIRYVRFRIGDFADKAMDGAGLGSCDHCIIDHCSISWSSDEGTSSRGAKNITFQRNIVAEALHHGPHYNAADRTTREPHAFAASISGDIGSYHHNLLAHCTDRNWSLAGGLNQAAQYAGRLDIRNNVVYNWIGRTTDGGVRELNYVNNYYKPYPKNKFAKWLLKLDPLNPAWGTESYYMAGNVMEGFDYESDNWKAFVNGPDVEKQVRVDHELYPSYVTTHTPHEAYTNVLADVGANFPKLDVIDQHVIKDVRDGTAEYIGTRAATYVGKSAPNIPGLIDTQSDDKSALGSKNFPWPDYQTYNVPVDGDHDGMPDDWEKAHGLNPNDPSDANKDLNGDGYTNLEKYLNSLVGETRSAGSDHSRPLKFTMAALAAMSLCTTAIAAEPERPPIVPAAAEGPIVADAEMQHIYDEVKTPYKYGVVLSYGEPGGLVDCPNVFRFGGKWYMLYVAAKDKAGYETCLASSDDLLKWTPLGKVLPFPESGWDKWQGDGGVALIDPQWGGTGELQTYDGKYWMSYIGGAKQGYEPDPLAIGIAWTTTPDKPIAWTRFAENPVLAPGQSDARPFEKATLYKSHILWDKAGSLGYPFVMYYNAASEKPRVERIGMAVSKDMKHWSRYLDGPVIDNGKGISGDPQIVRIDDLWVMLYFGLSWQPGTFDTFACSRDLVHWTKWMGPHLIAPSEPYEKTFAHKPWLLKYGGVVYHFYCAVGKQGRVIALATSKDLGHAAPALSPSPATAE